MYKMIQKFEGKYHDLLKPEWADYKSARECLSWQEKMQDILSSAVEIACVPATKASEYLANTTTPPPIPPIELTSNPPAWAVLIGWAMALCILILAAAGIGVVLIKAAAWMRGH
jgi:hypothetical protein